MRALRHAKERQGRVRRVQGVVLPFKMLPGIKDYSSELVALFIFIFLLQLAPRSTCLSNITVYWWKMIANLNK